MLNWPATPDRVEAPDSSGPNASSISASSAQVAVPNLTHLDRRVPTAKGKSPSSLHLVEPSPASTYGETAAGDSVPPTPGEIAGSSGLARTLRTLHLAPGQDVNPLEATFVDHASVFSPSHEITGLAGVTLDGTTAVTKEVELKSTTPSKHRAMPAVRSPGGVRRAGQSRESPGSTRRSGSIRDENWRAQRSVSFALPPGGNDPFLEAEKIPTASHLGTEDQVSQNATGGTKLDDDVSELDSPSCGSLFRPREDREVVEISGDNAQAIFPPNSCVFVANLVSTLTDEQLEYSVTRAFEQFGKVYVKIKRDPRGMPYAFCQYENTEDSEKAIQFGRGLMIDGRQCRTERAKVNRSLYLTRITGGAINEGEAREVLRGRGDLEKLWHPSPTEKEMFRLGDGIWVMFAFFQDCRDAQALFKDNPRYRLEAPHHPEEAQTRASSRSGPSPMSRVTPTQRYVSPPLYRMRQAERNSIFVGNLPADITQAQLRGLLAVYGNIRSIEVVSRPLVHSPTMNVFAYIEYSHEQEARRAANTEHVLNGVRLRVELKESHEQLLSRAGASASAGSPHPRRSSTAPREVAMARAFAMGLDTATVLQIFNVEYGYQNGTEHRNAAAQAAITPAVFTQVPYQGYYASSFPQYGMPTASEADHGSATVFGQAGQVPPNASQYSHYTGVGAPQFYPSYATHGPFGYQNQVSENTVNVASSASEGGHPS